MTRKSPPRPSLKTGIILGTLHGHDMAWHGNCHPANPLLAVLALCGSVWFRESVLALWRGPTKDREIGRNENAWPPDCSRSRRRSERRCTMPRCWRAMRRGWAICADERGRGHSNKTPSGLTGVGPSGVSYTSNGRRRGGRGGSQEHQGAWHRRAKNRRWGGHGNWQESV